MNTKKEFDPNAPGNKDAGIFGLPFTVNDAKIVLLPVSWDVTTSFRDGTSNGPKAILEASRQVDLFELDFGNIWKAGIAMDMSIYKHFRGINQGVRIEAKKCIDQLAHGMEPDADILKFVNNFCETSVDRIRNQSTELLNQGKIVGLIGGDHSTPLGLIQALASKYDDFSVLQIDAHMDLREAYEGFIYSHASIMYNVVKTCGNKITRLAQLGIRDVCEEEVEFAKSSSGTISTYFDKHIPGISAKYDWDRFTHSLIEQLYSKNLYISFDIDGLDQKYCPNTGTPVPGGLSFQQISSLFEKLYMYGIKVIGFDLNEVSPGNIPEDQYEGSWDANVGARVLYKLCGLTAKSNKLI